MSIETFIQEAGSGVAHHKEEEGLLLIGAALDESVKWVELPKFGKCMVIKKINLRCPMCHSETHNCLLLDKRFGADNKQAAVIECTTHKKFFGVLLPHGVM